MTVTPDSMSVLHTPTITEASEVTFLDPAQLRFFMAGATLRMVREEQYTCLKVTILRAFPLSNPRGYLSVRDGGGTELGIIRRLDDLAAGDRELVEKEIGRRYMVARVKAVTGVIERFGTVEWEVETDKGVCRFTTRDLRNNVIRLGQGRYILVDVEDNRFEVFDLYALDTRSQEILMRYL